MYRTKQPCRLVGTAIEIDKAGHWPVTEVEPRLCRRRGMLDGDRLLGVVRWRRFTTSRNSFRRGRRDLLGPIAVSVVLVPRTQLVVVRENLLKCPFDDRGRCRGRNREHHCLIVMVRIDCGEREELVLDRQ